MRWLSIAAKHHGTIDVISRQGERYGVCYVLTESKFTMSQAYKIGNLMIVDDSEQDHFLYGRIIKRTELVDELMFFSWAQDALDYLKKADRLSFNAILVDINMPRMNGFEFLEAIGAEIGEENLESKIIMLTTSLNERDRLRSETFKFITSYIDKPLSSEKLNDIAKLM